MPAIAGMPILAPAGDGIARAIGAVVIAAGLFLIAEAAGPPMTYPRRTASG
jgi:hypothetical protein